MRLFISHQSVCPNSHANNNRRRLPQGRQSFASVRLRSRASHWSEIRSAASLLSRASSPSLRFGTAQARKLCLVLFAMRSGARSTPFYAARTPPSLVSSRPTLHTPRKPSHRQEPRLQDAANVRSMVGAMVGGGVWLRARATWILSSERTRFPRSRCSIRTARTRRPSDRHRRSMSGTFMLLAADFLSYAVSDSVAIAVSSAASIEMDSSHRRHSNAERRQAISCCSNPMRLASKGCSMLPGRRAVRFQR